MSKTLLGPKVPMSTRIDSSLDQAFWALSRISFAFFTGSWCLSKLQQGHIRVFGPPVRFSWYICICRFGSIRGTIDIECNNLSLSVLLSIFMYVNVWQSNLPIPRYLVPFSKVYLFTGKRIAEVCFSRFAAAH